MSIDLVHSIRVRAELTRRLAAALQDPDAALALMEIAESLEADADELEKQILKGGRDRRVGQ